MRIKAASRAAVKRHRSFQRCRSVHRQLLTAALLVAMLAALSCTGEVSTATMSAWLEPPRPRATPVPPSARAVPRPSPTIAAVQTATTAVPTPPKPTPTPVAKRPAPPTEAGPQSPLAAVPPWPLLRAPSGRPAALTVTITLSSLDDIRHLQREPLSSEVLSIASRHPESTIYVVAYVTEGDTRVRHADPGNVADELVIETARFLADHGIDPNRISGKGMGIDRAIGRAIVVSFDFPSKPRPARESKPQEVARGEACDRRS